MCPPLDLFRSCGLLVALMTDSLPSDSCPELVYFDSHMHTPLCKHAYGQPIAYAETGIRRGLKGIIMTCHSPMPNNFSRSVRMDPEEFPGYVELVDISTQEMAGRIEVKLGLESDWFPGMEDWLTELHKSADFHYILGSVHPFLPEYKDMFWTGDVLDFQKGYFMHLADAAETGLFDCLAHPDIVKVMTAHEWHFEKLVETVDIALGRIAKTGVAMELNTSGLQKNYPEMNPGPEMLAMMNRHGIPVVVGSDSHRPQRVSEDFEFAFNVLQEAGYEDVSYYSERKRVDVPIVAAAASLNRTVAH